MYNIFHISNEKRIEYHLVDIDISHTYTSEWYISVFYQQGKPYNIWYADTGKFVILLPQCL